MHPIIQVRNLSKRYRIGTRDQGYKTFREAVIDGVTAPFRNFAKLRRLTHFSDNGNELTQNSKLHSEKVRGASWLSALSSSVLVGSYKGNLTYVRKFAELHNLQKQVHFAGFVSRQELAALYRNALALTFVSFFGPDNLPPLEAFALGCPVIAANVSGAREQLGQAALLVDPKEPRAIAEAVLRLHHRPELREDLIELGRERARQFTGKQYIEAILQIIDDFEPIRRCWSSTEPYHQL